jgi:hypothetical protein
MAWYEFHHMVNHFHGITPVLPPEELPFLFHPDDFEPEAIPNWKAPHVQISKDKRRKRGDFPCFGSLPPVLNARALAALKPLLAHCDILPLICDEEPLVAINPPILFNALDRSESVAYAWFEDGRFMNMSRPAFRGPRVPEEPLFRLAEVRNVVFVSEAFREAVEKNKLKGLYFEPLEGTWKP